MNTHTVFLLVVLSSNLIVGVQTAARGAVCVFCRSHLEILEKVLGVISQITQSRRQGSESYEAIPPRPSCRQDHLAPTVGLE